MQLLKSQKNELFEVLEIYGLSPSLFSFEYDNKNNTVAVRYTSHDDYCFKIDEGEVTFIPGTYTYSQEVGFLDWDRILYWFRTWLECIDAEISIIDKWQEFEREFQAVNIDFSTENEKFTHSEYKEIEQRIGLLKDEMSTIPEFQEHLENINQKLDHLTDMVEKLGKFDWRGLFVGTMVNIVTAYAVPPETTSHLWESVKQIFNTYLLKQ